MCGFAGYAHGDGARIDPGVLEAMRRAQHHRGPDDAGLATFSLRRGQWRALEPGVEALEGGFAFNRLSIQDLTAAGHQPMADDAGRALLVFNGEIYNAADYRPELEARGVRFRGHSDTEVLLHLYVEYGLEETLRRLNGMFAFALADLRTGKLVLARDRLGIKPLSFFTAGQTLLFASEAKSFLSHPAFTSRLDEDGLPEYLRFRCVAGARTLLRGVSQLEPGTTLTWDGKDARLARYWAAPAGAPDASLRGAKLVDEVESRLRASVRSQLLSDVPLGCQLSGGIDSSLVSALAKADSRVDLEGFSVVVDDAGYSEEEWIDEASRAVGMRANKFTLKAEGFIERLQRASWHLDQPLNHPNSVGIMFLAEHARRSVTVLLSGEGADEVFGGYQRFFRGQFFPLFALVRALSPVPWLRRRLANFAGDQAGWFIGLSGSVGEAHARELSAHADHAVALERRRAFFGRGPFMRAALNYELATYLPDLLLRQDKMTMAHSVENRVPFLDHTLVEFAATLPFDALVGRRPALGEGEMRSLKRVLKDLARRHFGERFVYRPKAGFGIPLRRFFGHAAMRPLFFDEVLPSARRRGVLNADTMQRWYSRLDQPGNAEALWAAVAFELWAKRFLDAPEATS